LDQTHPSRARPFLLRHKLLFASLGAGVLVVGGVLLGAAIFLSGALTTAATQQHSALTHWILERGLLLSLRSDADGIPVPPLGDAAQISRGLECYSAHCAQCHGAPGIGPDHKALGMMPAPGSLSQTARDWPPARLYYVTRKGIRMTGMPAWEFRLTDDQLWSTIAFLRILPELDRAAYQELVAAVEPHACATPDRDVSRPAATKPDVVLRQYGCHGCHQIDGVVGPRTEVGPPLSRWRTRKLIAGILPNTEANLVQWLLDPQALDPDSLMPDLGVATMDAQIMARHLLSQP
jgi:mono/diheme cytochrome c family protein